MVEKGMKKLQKNRILRDSREEVWREKMTALVDRSGGQIDMLRKAVSEIVNEDDTEYKNFLLSFPDEYNRGMQQFLDHGREWRKTDKNWLSTHRQIGGNPRPWYWEYGVPGSDKKPSMHVGMLHDIDGVEYHIGRGSGVEFRMTRAAWEQQLLDNGRVIFRNEEAEFE